MWARLLRDKKSINKKPHFICNHIAFSKRSARSVPVSCGSARSARTVSTPFSWQAHVIEESVFILVFTLFWPLWQQKLFILITIDRTNHKTRRTRKIMWQITIMSIEKECCNVHELPASVWLATSVSADWINQKHWSWTQRCVCTFLHIFRSKKSWMYWMDSSTRM